MNTLEYAKLVRQTLSDISRRTGYPFAFLLRRFLFCYLDRHIEIGEFRSLRLYELTKPRFEEYLTYRESRHISDNLCTGATKAEFDRFDEKHLFNETFAPFIRREWLYLPHSTAEEFRSFAEGQEEFLLKSSYSMRGDNIYRFRRGQCDPDEIFALYHDKNFVAESFIRQHPALDAVNPASVNTIRYIAARHGDAVAPVGAGLRTGGAGQFVDNFHHGGTAYPLDLETGVVTGPGIDLDGRSYLRHPVTGRLMPGLQVPHWEEVKRIVREASVVVPHVGYIGWDLAVTAEGAELIEGNINYPGNTIIQIDGPGPRRRLIDFCRENGVALR